MVAPTLEVLATIVHGRGLLVDGQMWHAEQPPYPLWDHQFRVGLLPHWSVCLEPLFAPGQGVDRMSQNSWQPRFFQSTVILIVCLVIITSGRLHAQMTLEDICASYFENQANFARSRVEFKWRNSVEYVTPETRFQEAFSAYAEAIAKSGWEPNTPQAGGGKYLQSQFDLVTNKNLNALRPDIGLFHVLYSPEGCRLTTCRASKVVDANWSDGLSYFDDNNEIDVFVANVSSGNFCARAISRKDPRNNRMSKSYWVFPRDAPELGIKSESIPSPVLLPFAKQESPFFSYLGYWLFAGQKLPARKESKISVRETGDIAIVEIEEPPLNPLAPDAKYGSRIYAEIETRKGCLPRLIKVSNIYELRGEIYRNDSSWEIVIEATNNELPGVGFFPSNTTVTSYAWFPTSNDVSRILENKTFEFPVEKGLARPADQILERERVKITTELASKWTPENSKDVFSLDIPSDAEIVIDRKTGKNYSQAALNAQAENKVRLKEKEDGPVERGPNKMLWISFWAALSLIGLLFLYIGARKKSRTGE